MAEKPIATPTTIDLLPPTTARLAAVTSRSLRWLFRRDDQRVEIATGRDSGRHYAADIRWPNGRQERQRFTDPDAMFQHVAQLSWQLRHSGFIYQAEDLEDRDDHDPPGRWW
jgi:hypothetical protein